MRCCIKMEIPSLGRLANSSRTVGRFLGKQSGKFLFERALSLPQGPIFTIYLPTHCSRDDSNMTNLPRPFSHALIYYSSLDWPPPVDMSQHCLLTRPLIPPLLGRIIRKATESLPRPRAWAYLSNQFSCQAVAETV